MEPVKSLSRNVRATTLAGEAVTDGLHFWGLETASVRCPKVEFKHPSRAFEVSSLLTSTPRALWSSLELSHMRSPASPRPDSTVFLPRLL
jgi:hypothetical protein